jgi:hypothetical protein
LDNISLGIEVVAKFSDLVLGWYIQESDKWAGRIVDGKLVFVRTLGDGRAFRYRLVLENGELRGSQERLDQAGPVQHLVLRRISSGWKHETPHTALGLTIPPSLLQRADQVID